MNTKKQTVIIAISVGIILLGLLGYSCIDHYQLTSSKLPLYATNVVNKGNGWIQFTLEGNVYLYHRAFQAYRGFEAITTVPKTTSSQNKK